MISGVLGHTEKNKKNICPTIRIQEDRNSQGTVWILAVDDRM